jgi:glycosyltransferase involved in cell wall biosynthesis
MRDVSSGPVRTGTPDISIIMPCYNEEEAVGYTIPKLTSAFEKAGYCLELVAVDNGSYDRTGELIKGFAERNASVVYHRVEQNRGYGYGVLCGIGRCRAPWVGIIPADGQVDAEDVVRLYESALATNFRVLAKVRRRFRMDGLTRKVVSTGYNILVRVLWPRLASIDINGSPKILPRDYLLRMQLKSNDWFLDPEMMIKAHYMGLRILELNVFARLRGSGVSHVRAGTCWEFFRNLVLFRISGDWKRGLKQEPAPLPDPMASKLKQSTAPSVKGL